VIVKLRLDGNANRYLTEREALKRLADVPGVVQLIDYGSTEYGEQALALEYLGTECRSWRAEPHGSRFRGYFRQLMTVSSKPVSIRLRILK
jgi:hypothetical protein